MPVSFARRGLCAAVCAALLYTLAPPVSAFFWNKQDTEPALTDMTRNVVIGQTLSFIRDDFTVDGDDTLSAITITSLPDRGCGVLCVGSQVLAQGSVIRSSALAGLCFQTNSTAQPGKTSFTFLPTFASGAQGDEVTVELYLLEKENQPPIAEHMALSTYKNVSVTGYFQALDTEGDVLQFQLTSAPARGSVTAAGDGSSRFVYTPNTNKTGKDSFTYVVTDSAGNRSDPATVTIQITKADTAVTYADMDGSEAHKAAIRMAEEGVFVGECVNGQYFFRPEAAVSRSEFLTMAMSVAGLEPLEDVSVTGFGDDKDIPTWAKGYVSSALKAGVIRGSRGGDGQVVFDPDSPITLAQAAAMLDDLLRVSDVAVESWAGVGVADSGHWALQSAANLTGAGVIPVGQSSVQALESSLTRAEVAQLLDNSLELLEQRENQGSWLIW